MPRTWYLFNCDPSPNAPYLPANYRRLTVKPTCTTGPHVCAINVFYPGSTAPLFPPSPLSNNIQQYITDGIATLLPQPQLPLNTKIFVYMWTCA